MCSGFFVCFLLFLLSSVLDSKNPCNQPVCHKPFQHFALTHSGPEDFEDVLESLEGQLGDKMEWDVIRSIGGNLNMRGLSYKSRKNPHEVGAIIVGEDEGHIAVDITLLDGAVSSFVLEDEGDEKGIQNIMHWFEESINRKGRFASF